jgi:hypothetical protein
MKTRTTKQWMTLLRTIKTKPVRVQVANIVWYDYISHRRIDRPWPTYLKMWRVHQGADPLAVEQALLQIGYAPDKAKRRSTIPRKP